MDFDDKAQIINQVMGGLYILDYYGTYYYIKEPDNSILSQGVIQRNLFRIQAQKDGFINRDQEAALLLKEDIWRPSDNVAFEKVKSVLSNLRGELKRYEFQSLKLAELKNLIEINEGKLKRMWTTKNTFYPQTIDYQVDYQYYCWLLSKCLYNTDNTLVWDSFVHLEADNDDRLLKYCVNKVFTEGIFTEAEIRELARSEPWRTLWKASGQTSPLTYISPIRMMYLLCYWSNIYDAVFESTDDLTNDQINDDAFINQWLMDKSTSRGKSSNTNYSENSKIKSAQEVFIKADSPEDAQKVYNTMNDSEGRSRLRARQKLIMDRGKVKETEMPDTQNFLKMVMNQAATAAIKNSTKR